MIADRSLAYLKILDLVEAHGADDVLNVVERIVARKKVIYPRAPETPARTDAA
jgi:hypothetical protein